ncbi:hypothetical protein [Leadbettera azotonutricia]|uniref:Putative lipoprotein n=1 Tax=Leadbettera azotonutricia (strain ATCC BAA-888 / DSM 13862 / ZAS-9) TaxID=545695 RepID=F5YEA0_LEAAZ|nr:hypothetical protein [Leadbettera azotonutricia]AEF81403.1 putative lipoprotein [Leadbettera azotonutricia ZAS-9]
MKIKSFSLIILIFAVFLLSSCGMFFGKNGDAEKTNLVISLGQNSARSFLTLPEALPPLKDVYISIRNSRNTIEEGPLNDSKTFSFSVPYSAGNAYTIHIKGTVIHDIEFLGADYYPFAKTFSGSISGVDVKGQAMNVTVNLRLSETMIAVPHFDDGNLVFTLLSTPDPASLGDGFGGMIELNMADYSQIVSDPYGRVFVGSNTGDINGYPDYMVTRFNGSFSPGNEITKFPSTASVDPIECLAFDPGSESRPGTLYYGLYGGKISFLETDDEAGIYTPASVRGLPDMGIVYALAVDETDGTLYAAIQFDQASPAYHIYKIPSGSGVAAEVRIEYDSEFTEGFGIFEMKAINNALYVLYGNMGSSDPFIPGKGGVAKLLPEHFTETSEPFTGTTMTFFGLGENNRIINGHCVRSFLGGSDTVFHILSGSFKEDNDFYVYIDTLDIRTLGVTQSNTPIGNGSEWEHVF